MVERTLIDDGGVLLYDPEFLAVGEAEALFAELLQTVPWKQEGGRGRLFPRLTAWYADPGVRYSYSGVTHEPAPWLPALFNIKNRIGKIARTEFNSLLLNLYRDGQDSIGMHADDEPELGTNPVIGSVSLGAVRQFVMRHKKTRERRTLDLAHGSLLVMGGTSQHHWLHGVPKTRMLVGQRINLTYRRILT